MADKPTYEKLVKRVRDLEKETIKLKRSDELLRESEERFRLLYERAPLGYQSLDESGHFLEVNQAWLDTLGYTREEVIGKSFGDFLHPEWVDHFKENFPRFKAVGEILGVEFEMVKKDGSFIMVTFTGKIGRDEKGAFKQTHGILEDITSRKQIEEALRESEEKFRSLAENSQDYILRYDEQGRHLYQNAAGFRVSGFSEEEFIGKTHRELGFDEDLCDQWEDGITRVFKSGEPTGEIFKWESVEGSIFLDLRLYPEFDPDGKVKTVLGVSRDITELKQAEEALRESEGKYRSLLDDVVDRSEVGIFILDSDFSIVWVNKALERYFGLKEKEVVGKNKRRLILEQIRYKFEDPEGFAEKVLATYDNNTYVENFECHMLPGDSRKDRWLEHWSQPIRFGLYAGGRVELYYDINDRKLSEKALKESEKRFRSIIESAEAGYFFIDRDGYFKNVNEAWLRMHKYSSADEVIGKHFSISQIDTDQSEAQKVVEKLLGGEPVPTGEFSRRCKDGSIGYHTFTVTPVIHGEKIIGLEGFIIDISEKKKLEAHLLQAQKMEAVATLAGGVAHQFNNALSAVTVNLDMLGLDSQGNETINNYVKKMKESSHRMAQLTSQLLAYAQGGKYQVKTISLSDFIMETLPVIKHAIKASVNIDTELSGDIWSVKADLTQIQMVLSAILMNASEAIDGKGRVLISAKNEKFDEEISKKYPYLKSGRYVCLTVKDDGKGMDPETKNRIFEPFFTTKFQGRGLGMAAAYGIVKNHEGFISVESELGKGTIIRIYLPEVEAEAKEPKAPKIEPVKGTGTILVIEDQKMVMDAIRAALERLGYRILEAETGKEAIDIAKTFDGDIELAILDIVLPDMSGREVYPIIMEARPNLKVIVCSGYSIDSPAREILSAGAQDFIQKPFSITEISEKLKEVLEGKIVNTPASHAPPKL